MKPDPRLLSDRNTGLPAGLRPYPPGFRDRARPGGLDARHRAPDAVRVHETVAVAGVRPAQRADLGALLCLLLRTNSVSLSIAAAIVTVCSKFVIRINGKHLFNPTNFGVVAMMLATGLVWVSPAQWGNVAFFAFLMACLGGLVVNRAARSDVTFAFIVFYMSLVFGRLALAG
mgnify:CR=1 FL=1